MMNKRRLGAEAEEFALNYLKQQGLFLIHQNFYSHAGEIDLIMKENDYLVFIEVRQRTHTGYGDGVASVGFSKQQKIIKTAHFFLLKHKSYAKMPCRFDIISLNQKVDPPIECVKNAFEDHC
jgi:putative endonuclease